MSAKSAVQKLLSSGIDLNSNDVPDSLRKACFVICNDYTNSKWPELGAGPNNDAYHVIKFCKAKGYQCFHLRNGKSQRFLQVLADFLRNTTEHLVVFYVGHGTNVRDKNGDENDGYDEAMVFDDAFVVDDVLIKTLLKYKNDESILTLVTDACHSGSIWDLQSQVEGRTLPPNIISISAATDKQTAKQTVKEQLEQGMFTYFMKRAVKANPDATPLDLRKEMKPQLQRYQQNVTIATTSEELLHMPTF